VHVEGPVNEEPYCPGRLEQCAATLAAEHKVSAGRERGRKLLLELEEKRRRLAAACSSLKGMRQSGRVLSPIAEWLAANLPVLENHLHEFIEFLPKDKYDELPQLEDGELAGSPRIHAIALALIAEVENCLDADTLKRFIQAYQSISPLTLSELWGLASTLQLVLLENLQRIAARVLTAHEECEETGALPHQSSEVNEGQPASLAASQATLENIFNSVRLLSTLGWPAFLESISLVNRILCQDPAGVYPLMEFATRDSYRCVVEHIARRVSVPEQDVARCAIELAAGASSSHPADERLSHVGYYLIDEGRVRLEGKVGYKPRGRERAARAIRRHPTVFSLGAISFLTSLVLALLLLYVVHAGVTGVTLAWLPVLVLIPASELALKILDLLLFFKPSVLPKMDFARGIPEELQTMVVVPTIFSSEIVIRELLETIEAHYVANQDNHIFFALLGDWSDAPQERMPDDDALLEVALNGIRELNTLYREDSKDRFYLFHRRRQWNQSEEKWMGWERKRGKLQEFNRLLRGARRTSYLVCTAGQDFLSQIRYVITLDSDTHLPRDAARRFIGTIAHPLNRPKLDALTGRVVRGYGIIQPRVSNLPPSAARSHLPLILTNYIRLGPEPTMVPDIYQGLFGEGIYVGKGLCEVDTFETALKDRTPADSVLSHDLYEGLYARPALVPDIKVLESRRLFYEAFVTRQHRWTRGDWQLLPWLLPRVRDGQGQTVRNVLPVIARWKILDNMRRSLLLPALFLWWAAGWTLLQGSPTSWTLLVWLVFALSVYLPVVKKGLLVLPNEIPRISLFDNIKYIAKVSLVQFLSATVEVLFLILFLAHQALFRADAIVRTLYRLMVSRKHLLEWNPAAEAQRESKNDLRAFLRLMSPVVIIAFALLLLILINKPAALIPAAPFLLAWSVSPFIAYRLNRQMHRSDVTREQKAEDYIRLKVHRLWRDFEGFMNNENHGRAPVIEDEKADSPIAHRTSLTNHLRLLLWTTAAHDIGRVGTLELVERLENAFVMIEKSETFGGAYLQDNDDMPVFKPPAPLHVLDIENGNLAAHLHVLKHAWRKLVNQPLFDERVLRGLADTILLMKEAMAGIGRTQRLKDTDLHQQLRREIEACAALAPAREPEHAPRTLSAWHSLFSALAQQAATIDGLLNKLSNEHGAGEAGELRFWTNSLISQTREFNRDLKTLAPWASIRTAHPATLNSADDAAILGQWANITEMLDRVPAISRLQEDSPTVLDELGTLRAQLDQCSQTTGRDDRLAVLSELDALTSAVEAASKTSQSLLSRYARLARQSEAVGETMDLRALFDEEHKVLRSF
jgi:cyclic beta-1,2-glucan synthetase